MDLFAEPKMLVATQVNMPTVSGDAFTHCNVEVPLDRSLVLVMVMETLLLLRGSPLCIHTSKGRGTPSKLHVRVKVLFMSSNSLRLLVVVTSGAAKIVSRENTVITMLPVAVLSPSVKDRILEYAAKCLLHRNPFPMCASKMV